MRRLLAAVIAAIVSIVPAKAQDWPTKPVTIIVPFAAGTTPDIVGRLIGDRLQSILGQTFVVENKAGASGNIGTAAVARAQPDGTTLGLSIVGPLALNTLLFAKMPYDPRADLALISVLATQPSILVANKGLGLRNVDDLKALLKRDDGKLAFGSIGNGSLSHLAMEAIALKSGTKLLHIPYNGSPAVVTALIRGDVQMAVLPAASVVPQGGDTGSITLLAVTSSQRSPLLPDLPTLAEAGIDGVKAGAWIGLIAPAKTDPAILSKLERLVKDIMSEPQIRDRLKAQYLEPVASTHDEFLATLDAELALWGPIIKANGIKLSQ